MNAASIDSGMTAATIRLARISPRKRKSSTETRIAPSARLCATVLDRALDEIGAVIVRQHFHAGRQTARSATSLALTRSTTVREF